MPAFPIKKPVFSEARSFIALDGLRGVAAVMVAVRHAPFLWSTPAPMGFMKNSYLAVDIFFVLSGFVLEHAYSERFRKGMSIASFMSARFQRLYPLYALAFILAVPTLIWQMLMGSVSSQKAFLELAFGLLMLPTPNVADININVCYPLNYVAWSLFFELAANLLFVMIGAHLGTKLLSFLVGGFAFVLVISVLNGWFGFDRESASGVLDGGVVWATFGVGVLRVGFSFFAGVFLYRIYRHVRPFEIGTISAVLLLFLVMAVLAGAFYGAYRAELELAAVILVFPSAIFLLAATNLDSSVANVMRVLGLVSYGVYVLQIPTYLLIESGARHLGIPLVWTSVVAVPAVTLLAYFATVAIDIPIRRWIKIRLPHALLVSAG